MKRLHLLTFVIAAAALTACGKKEELPAPAPAPTPVADAASAAVTESVEAAKAVGNAASAAAIAAGDAASAAVGAAVDTAKDAAASVKKEKKGGCLTPRRQRLGRTRTGPVRSQPRRCSSRRVTGAAVVLVRLHRGRGPALQIHGCRTQAAVDATRGMLVHRGEIGAEARRVVDVLEARPGIGRPPCPRCPRWCGP